MFTYWKLLTLYVLLLCGPLAMTKSQAQSYSSNNCSWSVGIGQFRFTTGIAVAPDEKSSGSPSLTVDGPPDQSELARIATSAERNIDRYMATMKLENQSVLAKVATEDLDVNVRLVAVARLQDQSTLAVVAARDPYSEVRLAAVRRLEDQPTLALVASHDSSEEIRLAAVERLSDRALLESLVIGSIDWKVAQRAFAKAGLTSQRPLRVRVVVHEDYGKASKTHLPFSKIAAYWIRAAGAEALPDGIPGCDAVITISAVGEPLAATYTSTGALYEGASIKVSLVIETLPGRREDVSFEDRRDPPSSASTFWVGDRANGSYYGSKPDQAPFFAVFERAVPIHIARFLARVFGPKLLVTALEDYSWDQRRRAYSEEGSTLPQPGETAAALCVERGDSACAAMLSEAAAQNPDSRKGTAKERFAEALPNVIAGGSAKIGLEVWLLRDSSLSFSVRKKLVHSLGAQRAAAAVDALLEVLNDEHLTEPAVPYATSTANDLRDEAAWSLGNIGDRKAIESLIRAVSNPALQYQSNVALKYITGQWLDRSPKEWLEWWNAEGRNETSPSMESVPH